MRGDRHVSMFRSVEEIEKGVWNSLAAGASPMMEWEYYYALEKSGCVSPRTGYIPSYLMVWQGKLPVLLAPFFERQQASDEFGGGDLIEFLGKITGIPYNHGLVGNIPLTPVPAYEFLQHPESNPVETASRLLDYVDAYCRRSGFLTSRIYFVSPDASYLDRLLAQRGYLLIRTDHPLWFNRNYKTFEDYLWSFKSARRTKIKRELGEIRKMGIHVRMMDGSSMPGGCYDDIYDLYCNTWFKHMDGSVSPFLNREFFRLLGKSFAHRCSFCVADWNRENVAMALFFEKAGRLFGRYWGCVTHIPFLHFATCYYYPIEYAILNGIEVFDPGFGGQHKLFRGCQVVASHHYVKFYGERERKTAFSVLRALRALDSKL